MKKIKISLEFKVFVKVFLCFTVPLLILFLFFEIRDFSDEMISSTLNIISNFSALFLALYAFTLWRTQRVNNAAFEHNVKLLELSSRIRFVAYDFFQARLNEHVYNQSKIEEHRFTTHPRIHTEELYLKFCDILGDLISSTDILYIYHHNLNQPDYTKRLSRKISAFKNFNLFLINGFFLTIEKPNNKNSNYILDISIEKAPFFTTIFKNYGFYTYQEDGDYYVRKIYKNNDKFYEEYPNDFQKIIEFYYEDVVQMIKRDINSH